MRTLILYSSKYGFTEKSGKTLGEHMDNDVVLKNCTKDFSIDLTKFDNVIIGSSIYVGKPSVTVLDFCESYQRLLMNKKLASLLQASVRKRPRVLSMRTFQKTL